MFEMYFSVIVSPDFLPGVQLSDTKRGDSPSAIRSSCLHLLFKKVLKKNGKNVTSH